MKNSEIVFLANNGALVITNHTLSPAHAYKVFKFRKALAKAFEAIQESEKSLLSDCGVEDARAFDARLEELRAVENPTDEQKAELNEKTEIVNRYVALRNQMYGEDVTLDCHKIPYEEWFKLQNENKEVEVFGRKVDVLSGLAEDVLEGVLWEAPEE